MDMATSSLFQKDNSIPAPFLQRSAKKAWFKPGIEIVPVHSLSIPEMP